MEFKASVGMKKMTINSCDKPEMKIGEIELKARKNLAKSKGSIYNKNFAERRRRMTDESISFN